MDILSNPEVSLELLKTLQRVLEAYFTLDEIDTLCFKLGVEYENVKGDTRSAKSRELVKYSARREMTESLCGEILNERPFLATELSPFHQSSLPYSPSADTVKLERYLKQIVEEYRRVYVNHANNITDHFVESVLLDDVFVPPDVQPGRVQMSSSLSSRIPLLQLIQNVKKLVLVGPAGAGKTTFLSFLAVTQARTALDGAAKYPDPSIQRTPNLKLPILINLKHYEDAHAHDPSLSLISFILARFENKTGPKVEFRELLLIALRAGNAFIILDALDEIGDEANRLSIARDVTRFVSELHQDTHVIVARRSERSGLIEGDFQSFVLCDLSRDQVSIFADRWCQAIRSNADEAKTEKFSNLTSADICRSIWRIPPVRHIASNPRLLLALIFSYLNNEFDKRRSQVYYDILQVVMSEWGPRKHSVQNVQVGFDEISYVLSGLAVWFYGRLSRKPANAHEIVRQCARSLAENRHLQSIGLDVRNQGENVFKQLHVAGILSEHASGQFGFAQHGLQQYFAALDLYQQKTIIGAIEKARQKPEWQYIVALALSFLSYEAPDQAENIISRDILKLVAQIDSPNPLTAVDTGDLLLAGHCILECLDVSASLHSSVLHELVLRYLAFDQNLDRPEIYRAFHSWFAHARDTDLRYEITQIFLVEVSSSNSQPIVESALTGIGYLGCVHAGIVDALLIYAKDERPKLRAAAIKTLGQLRVGSEVVLKQIATALEDANPIVKRSAIQALTQINQPHEIVKTSLITSLKDSDVSAQSAQLLADQFSHESSLVATIIDLIRSEAKARAASVLFFQAVGRQDATSIQDTLLTLLQDKDQAVRRCGIKIVGKLDILSKSILDELFVLLRNDKSRKAVSDLLPMLFAKHPTEVRPGLELALRDEDRYVRNAVVSILKARL